jgi:hypothetical protein
MEFDFIERCEKQLRPLGVTVVAELGSDNVYYAIFDGSRSPLSKQNKWTAIFGLDFEQLTKRLIMETEPALESEQPSDHVVRFKIGTLFDILSKKQND